MANSHPEWGNQINNSGERHTENTGRCENNQLNSMSFTY